VTPRPYGRVHTPPKAGWPLDPANGRQSNKPPYLGATLKCDPKIWGQMPYPTLERYCPFPLRVDRVDDSCSRASASPNCDSANCACGSFAIRLRRASSMLKSAESIS
jgi:hypothetical protein